jgi:predicted RNA binding protein YcfA (HicA-like mRNA interferase family)
VAVMNKIAKLKKKIYGASQISYDEAEKILMDLGFTLKIKGSHHIFTKQDYVRNISIKKRKQLLPYQIHDIRQVLKDHGYEE